MEIRNTLLATLLDIEFENLAPRLSRHWLPAGALLIDVEEPPEWGYFPESGMVSVIAAGADERRSHVGLYGFEGFGSLAIVLGAPTSSADEIVQIGGYFARISAEHLSQAMATLPAFRRVMLRYAHVFLMQVANTVLCNGHGRIEQRLARWLLMCQDRMRSPTLAITHQSLSMILGVRRAGVTEAIHVLEGRRLIQAQRGLIHILDRERLMLMTGGSYGKPEAEYRRLI
jgi:CRP-like cAMP-binding protein